MRGGSARLRASSRRLTVLSATVVALAAFAAYYNSFGGPFILDDVLSIVENRSITRLWPPWTALSPPVGSQTVSGRPLVNLSLAVNYAIGGLNVRSYHALNLLVHVLAALVLFGVLRRTFLLPALRDRFGRACTPLATAAALLWAVHPLQTESVTYIVQRAESIVGLFYLLTLYGVIRGAQSPRGTVWYAGAAMTCLLGAASKEVMATAPLAVFLYDGLFLAGSFREALRKRWGLYVAMAATWGLLGYLVVSTDHRGGTAGFGTQLSTWSYARSQFGIIVHYLRLCVWPSPLVLHYGSEPAKIAREIVPWATLIAILAGATVVALWRRLAIGYLGAWFALALAPTSSIVPTADLVFEHRMYLALAAPVVLAVTCAYTMWDRLLARIGTSGPAKRWAIPAVVLVAVTAALGGTTVMRNRDYRSKLAIYQDTVNKRPRNFRAWVGLGSALFEEGKTSEAIEDYERALRLNPGFADAHNNLGNALLRLRRTEEAIEHYRKALRLEPNSAKVLNNLGKALATMGKPQDALEYFERALRIDPWLAGAHVNLGNALLRLGRPKDGIGHYEEALRLRPDDAEISNDLGIALARSGRTQESIRYFERALRLEPAFAEAHNNLGSALVAVGRAPDAIGHFEEALRLRPDSPEIHCALGDLLAWAGRTGDAASHYEQAMRLKPDQVRAIDGLAWLLATHDRDRGGDPARAVGLALRERELTGDGDARSLDTLAAAYAAAGRFQEAVATAQRAVSLASTAGQDQMANIIETRLGFYRDHRAFREAARPAEGSPLPGLPRAP
ncbi:MAG: tetratricopeptide repeat protein [Acidobacteriia bacterium]|nr:tetratricopeptide repeat protein [Terriglobia bacterium]